MSQRWRFGKFCLVGVSGLVVNLASVWLLDAVLLAWLPGWWRTGLSYLGAILVSIFTNFVLNDSWTWRDRRGSGASSWPGRLGRYYAVSALAALLQYLTSLGVTALCAWHLTGAASDGVALRYKWLAVMVGVAVGTAVNFLVNHFWTYRKSPAG